MGETNHVLQASTLPSKGTSDINVTTGLLALPATQNTPPGTFNAEYFHFRRTPANPEMAEHRSMVFHTGPRHRPEGSARAMQCLHTASPTDLRPAGLTPDSPYKLTILPPAC